MKKGINFLPLMIFLCVTIAFGYLEANAQTFLPVGPQTNVPVATVTQGGWTECYRDLYENHMDADEVLSDCPGNQLMLSCRETGSPTLMLLAQGERSDVTFDTGNDNNDDTHIANGVGWYFNNTPGGAEGEAWGFVRAGNSVDKSNCDTDTSGADDERLCWHLHGSGGFRCGVIPPRLNGSTEFERIVYVPEPRPEPIPTLSEWGLIVMAGILGIAGFMVMRRRKATA